MYCPKCGTNNKDDVNFCMKCGYCFNDQLQYKSVQISKSAQDIKPKYTIKGINGQLYVYENKVEIKRKGIFALATQGLKGTKTIVISAIKSVQVKSAGFMAGYIQFGVLGSVENRGGLQAANYDENSVTFGNADNKTATQIKEYIESLIYNNSNSQGNVVQVTSDADELLKFKKLLDDGVITQEEFDAKKKQILNL